MTGKRHPKTKMPALVDLEQRLQNQRTFVRLPTCGTRSRPRRNCTGEGWIACVSGRADHARLYCRERSFDVRPEGAGCRDYCQAASRTPISAYEISGYPLLMRKSLRLRPSKP